VSCVVPGHLYHPVRYSNVAISKAGAEDCKSKCLSEGYSYFGLECPMGSHVHCQCSNDFRGHGKGVEYCRGKGNPLVHAHAHCTGPYEAEGYLFGDYAVASVYATSGQATSLPVTDQLALDLRGDQQVSGGKWGSTLQNGIVADVPGAVKYNKDEKAFEFPGRSAVISVPLATNPSKMQAVTYSAWVKPLEYQGLGWIISQYPDYGWSRSVAISDWRLGGTGVTPGNYNSGIGNLPIGQWSHVVGVWSKNGGPCSIYANTVKYSRTCSNGQGSNSAEKLIIGGRGPNDGGHNPKVLITDIAIFKKALSDDEVKKLFNGGTRPSQK